MQTVAGQPLQLVVLYGNRSTICNIGFVVGVGGTATSTKSTMAVVGQLVVPATTPSTNNEQELDLGSNEPKSNEQLQFGHDLRSISLIILDQGR